MSLVPCNHFPVSKSELLTAPHYVSHNLKSNCTQDLTLASEIQGRYILKNYLVSTTNHCRLVNRELRVTRELSLYSLHTGILYLEYNKRNQYQHIL